MKTLLPLERARVYFDGLHSSLRLCHPEGLAFDAQGNLYCGGENGEIFRISPGGASIELVARTGGFTLGVAFGPSGELFTCDLMHRCIYAVKVESGAFRVFARGAAGRDFQIPNFPLFDAQGHLYVSDSHAFKSPGPGIFRFDPQGNGELWDARSYDFANGLALTPDEKALLVVESFARQITRVRINDDGSAGERTAYATGVGIVPDGIAFDSDGAVYVACYEPSAIVRVRSEGAAPELLIGDPEGHLFCHPTNLAFWNGNLYTANLGRWHITEVDLSP
jgi:gluconolactonase